jgi:hypothetical protein
MKKKFARFCVAAMLASSSGGAATIYMVELDTSPLPGHPAAPFSVYFQLNDGSGAGDANNTAIIGSFDFGGGSAVAGTSVNGGASGDLFSGISITDSAFFNSLVQGFVPGSYLRFSLALTGVPDAGGIPDQFSFAILDSSGFELPYLSVFNAALVVDLTDSGHLIQTAGTDPAAPPFGGGDPIAMDAPTVTSAVPEPATSLVCLVGFAVWYSIKRARRRAA